MRVHTILIVDDHQGTREGLAQYLELEGYATLSATSAEDGLTRLEEGAPDLVLLDVNLPGMDGLEMLAQLRGRGSTVKVIMMSGEATIAKAVEATRLGALDFLVKDGDLDPVRGRVLITLRNALDPVGIDDFVTQFK